MKSSHTKSDYSQIPLEGGKGEVLRRLHQISALVDRPSPGRRRKDRSGRSGWTRLLDAAFSAVRRHAPWLHRAGSILSAALIYLYARLTVWTARLRSDGSCRPTQIPKSSVLAVWHGCAPSLLVSILRRRPRTPIALLVSTDPRGDFLALLCRWLGFRVVRGDSRRHPLQALAELACTIEQGGSALITADGWGPARIAKRGALMLASAADAPLVPVGADCSPAFAQHRKWDASRNPLPFSRVSVVFGKARRWPFFSHADELEGARQWLSAAIEESAQHATRDLR